MAYKELHEINTSEGIHTLYIYVNDIIPIFTPLLLFGIFLITLLASYFSSMRLRGDANFSSSFAVAGFFVSVIATFMSFIPKMINLTTLVICYAVALIGFLWLIIDNKN